MTTQLSPEMKAFERGWDAYTLGHSRDLADADAYPDAWRRGWDENRAQRFVGSPDEFETPQDLDPDTKVFLEDSDGDPLPELPE